MMQFSSPSTAKTYSERVVSNDWLSWANDNIAPNGKDIVDIGCGGGIYSRGFIELGAKSVVGVDSSAQYISEETAKAQQGTNLRFQEGNATNSLLESASADVVFERALIHHLSDNEKLSCAHEAKRLLRQGGMFVVQDRTIEDVKSSNPAHWIRATLFESFPHLLKIEEQRRPAKSDYTSILTNAGFAQVMEQQFDEVRKVYSSFEELRNEILLRKGKSILFELSDQELVAYCEQLRIKSTDLPLVERDLWTVWIARLGLAVA